MNNDICRDFESDMVGSEILAPSFYHGLKKSTNIESTNYVGIINNASINCTHHKDTDLIISKDVLSRLD